MSTRGSRSLSGRRRMLAAVAGLAVLVGVVLAPSATVTDAAFTDSEHASGALTAMTLQPPQITVPMPLCQRPPLVGNGDLFTIRWRWPVAGDHTAAFNSSLAAGNIRWKVNSNDNVVVPSTGPDANGFYLTTFSTTLLGGLVGSLLGVNIIVEMRTVLNSWTSTGVSSMTYNAPLLSGVSCTVANAPLP